MKVGVKEGFLYLKGITEREAMYVNGQFHKGTQSYRVPLNLYSVREVIDKLGTNDELNYLKAKLNQKAFYTKRDKEGTPASIVDERLREYQRIDACFIKKYNHVGVFNEQRTGKTPTTITATNDYDFRLVVVPASLLLQWKGEVVHWSNHHVEVYNGTKPQRQKKLKEFKGITKSKTLIISYETFRNDSYELLAFMSDENGSSVIICDEAHRIGNHKTKLYKELERVSKRFDKRVAMTGTPAMNHPSDVYGILRYLYPKMFSSYWNFVDRYFHVHDGFFGKEIGGYKRKDELRYVLDMISIQRKRSEVMKWLPKKQYQVVELDPSKKQMKAYESILNTFEYEHIDAPSVLAQLTRLRQITLAPTLLEIEAESAKERWLMDFIHDNPSESIIVFSSFTSYLKMLHEQLKDKAVILHGEMSAKDKQKSVDAFQAKEKRILLSNIQAGGTGWTLDEGTTTIFLDRHYNPTHNAQAEDRTVSTREDKKDKATLIIDLVLKDTVDEKILSILKGKNDLIKYVNDYGLKNLLETS